MYVPQSHLCYGYTGFTSFGCIHPSNTEFITTVQLLPEENPLPTTPSTLPSLYLFFFSVHTYIYSLIVVACHRPETEPSSSNHTVQHTREGAVPLSTVLVTPAEEKHSLPETTIELVPEPPTNDPSPSLPVGVLESASAISAEPVKGECSPNAVRCPALRRENSWVSNSNQSGHVVGMPSRI